MYICRESTVQVYFACSLPLSQFSFLGATGPSGLTFPLPGLPPNHSVWAIKLSSSRY